MKTKLVIVRFDKHYICEYKNWKTLFDICIKCSDYYFWKDYFENNDNDLIKECFTINIAKKYEYTVMLESDWIKLRNENHLKAHNLKVEAFEYMLDFNDPINKEIDYYVNKYRKEKREGYSKANQYNFQEWLVEEYLSIVCDPC